MRTKNSIKNAIFSLLSNFITIIIGLVAQAIFIKILGSEYLGLNSLFGNVITMLAIVELGMGNAIIYSLYKPIAENNVNEIKSLMKFYKKNYSIIGGVVAILGIAIIPFLQYIVNFDSITIDINVYLVYLLFLLETVLSYFLSYKRSILYANQQNSIISIVHIIYIILLNILQLVILCFTKNYYLYLFMKIFCRVLENLGITIIANKKYPYLKDKKVKPLDKKIEKEIYKKIKALFFHKIGTFVVLGSDNIIISKFLGLVTVGLYSNYYMIIHSVQTVFGQIINSTTASIGNLLVTENDDKVFQVFKRIRFLNFWISVFSCTSILVIMKSFICIWIGEKYLLSNFILIVLVINLYQKLMRTSYSSFKEAAGIYYEDRFVPIIESMLNIIVSIICCLKFGLAGVFIGTIVSGLALWCYSYPKFVYKKLFNRSYKNYIKETLSYILIFLIILYVTYNISNLIKVDNIWLEFIFNCVVSVILPNIILLLVFIKNENFKYFKNKALSILKNKKMKYKRFK